MILDRIIARKKIEIAAARRSTLSPDLPPLRDFAAALKADGLSLIAEIKRRSPSRGAFAGDFDPVARAKAYVAGGARALSVLTDAEFFGGSPSDLAAARAACDLPVLRKDFIIDEVQVADSRAMGADAILLIARVLTPRRLEALHAQARRLGLAVLVEIHDEKDLDAALGAGAEIIGINNRDLGNFKVSIETTLHLRPLIPAGRIVVSESGIRTREQTYALETAGIDAILVGDALMRAADPAVAVRKLIGNKKEVMS